MWRFKRKDEYIEYTRKNYITPNAPNHPYVEAGWVQEMDLLYGFIPKDKKTQRAIDRIIGTHDFVDLDFDMLRCRWSYSADMFVKVGDGPEQLEFKF
jgi:hypothetical protein